MEDESDRFTLAHRSFGGHIRALRRARRLTLDGLAERCALSGDTLRRIESGRISPTLETILKVASGLELLPSTLFAGLELSDRATVGELRDLLRMRSEPQARLALRLLRVLLEELDVLLAELGITSLESQDDEEDEFD